MTVRRGIENWIKLYNERRLHSALGYQTPAEMRRAWVKRIAEAVYTKGVSEPAPTPRASNAT
jgi:hypothetical protein